MDKDIPVLMTVLEEETEQWLESVVQTCLAHMHYMEDADPKDITFEDEGLLELERAIVTLYALHKKGALPSNDNHTH